MKYSTEEPGEHTDGDRALERRSRELFNEQVDGLDARTRSRLNQARQAALTAARGESRTAGSRWLLPVGSAAALGLVTISSLQLMHTKHSAEQVAPASVAVTATNAADDIEIIASNEELDMLQNVDFYAWLDTQADGLDANSSVSETG